LIACQRGLAARGGAEGVGRATTSAVVTSLFAIVVIDAIFTVLYNAFGRRAPHDRGRAPDARLRRHRGAREPRLPGAPPRRVRHPGREWERQVDLAPR